MRRPVMDPMFLREQDDARRQSWLTQWLFGFGRLLRWTGRALLSRPFRGRMRRSPLDEGTPAARALRGIGCRLLFLPLLLAGASTGLVYLGTHPKSAPAGTDPGALGVYYDPINLLSLDGTPLQAWFVPVIDARRVLLHRERLLSQRYPAVVLAHGFGQSPAQMLPLVAPLHEEGFVVVAVGLRGVGAGAMKGQTFGINESLDISATVDMLRRRPFVDPERIAVIGVGTGANAALLAAKRDPSIRAIILADPLAGPELAVARFIGPDQAGLRWMQLPNRLAFQIIYHLDLDDMNATQAESVSIARPVLRLQDRTDAEGQLKETAVNEIRAFCHAELQKAGVASGAVARGPARE